MITIYTPEEVEKIAAAGRLTADTLSMLEKEVKPGISTLELDEMAEKFIRDRGGIPSCKGYEGYPATLCTSVNDTVVHGIPSARKILKKGDIISLDLVVELNGYMGDSCITVPVGHTNKKNLQLIKATEGALFAGIKQAVIGNTVGDIGWKAMSSHTDTASCVNTWATASASACMKTRKYRTTAPRDTDRVSKKVCVSVSSL